MSQPRAFISYSWNQAEGLGHEEWVLKLAGNLRANSVNVRLDKWITRPGDSLSQFMEDEVANADFVVAVCTPAFAAKANERAGTTGYEQQIVSGQILAGAQRSKFIPVLRKGVAKLGADCALPNLFLGTIYLDFRDDANFEASLEDLVRAVYVAPKLAPPPVQEAPPAYVTRSKRSVGLSNPVLTVEIDDDFQLIGGETVATEQVELLRAYRGAGYEATVKVSLPALDQRIEQFGELSRALNDRQISPTELGELLSLRKELLRSGILEEWGPRAFNRIDDFRNAFVTIASLQDLLGTHFSDDDLARVWYSFTRRESRSFDYPDGASFDVYPKSQAHSCVVRLTKQETSDLESAEGMPVQYLTNQWGLRVDHLPRNVLLDRVIPAVVQDFVRHTRWTKTPMGAAKFLEEFPWRMGLH